MTIKEAKEQLEQVIPYFKGFTLELKDKEKGNMFAPRLITSIGDIKVQCFLEKYDDLMSVAITNHRSIALEQGRRKGIESGKTIRSAEFRELLNIKE